MNVDRHKVFISYYHKDDQYYKNELIKKQIFDTKKYQFKSIFEDYSVGDGDIDDTGMTSEQIRRKIRDEYIKDATVLILLCGENTKYRKHIDWEIHAAMYDSEVNRQMGIIVINLPNISQGRRASSEEEKNIISPYGIWVSLNNRSEYENLYPYMPSRIIDNFVKDIPIAVVDWDVVNNNPEKLMKLIDIAYKRRFNFKYDHSTPLRRNNS